ncbi:MAG: ComEC/Rec2 family competence protein, partial [Chloroflexota bacterium]
RPYFKLPQFGTTMTRLWLGSGAIVALLVWFAVLSLPDGYLHIAFLDVGQGDAILITTPSGRQILIDGGPSATQLNWRLGQEMPFWDRSLDLVVNTHPDADHLAGLVSVLDRYQVDQVLGPNVAAQSQLYQAWERELDEDNLTLIHGYAGMQLPLDEELVVEIIHPESSMVIDGINNHSLVWRLQFGEVSFLLPGDIEKSVENRLVSEQKIRAVTVLKSPHHGSKTSSTDLFLDQVDPQLVIISVGAENRFGHPAPEVLQRYTERGLTVLRTDQHGTIELITDGERLWVETAR